MVKGWQSQKLLAHKYQAWDKVGQIHKHLQAEADYQWQFTKAYKEIAEPLGAELLDASYDLDDGWRKMRLRHAKECWAFAR